MNSVTGKLPRTGRTIQCPIPSQKQKHCRAVNSAPAYSVISTSVTTCNCLEPFMKREKSNLEEHPHWVCSQGKVCNTIPSVWVGFTQLLRNLLEIQSRSQAQPLVPAQDCVLKLLNTLDLFVCNSVLGWGGGGGVKLTSHFYVVYKHEVEFL